MPTSPRRTLRALRLGPAARRKDAAGQRVGALFDEFAPMVLAVCRSHLRDPQAAEDAAQETFLNAHRSLLGGTEPRDPAAWLATIARNECRRVGRTARPAPLDEDTAVSRLDPAHIVAGRSDLSDVSGAIAALPARQREALVLREFCGLSYEQIGAAMSVSSAAVDALLIRARRRIVEQLGEIPRTTHGTLVVPAALREDLARLIPGLDASGATAGAGAAGAVATALGLGSAPVGAKIAATCAATVVLAVPLQATSRGDETPRSAGRAQVDARGVVPRASEEARSAPAASSFAVRRSQTRSTSAVQRGVGDGEPEADSSGHGSSGSGSSGDGSDSGSGGSGSGDGGSGPAVPGRAAPAPAARVRAVTGPTPARADRDRAMAARGPAVPSRAAPAPVAPGRAAVDRDRATRARADRDQAAPDRDPAPRAPTAPDRTRAAPGRTSRSRAAPTRAARDRTRVTRARAAPTPIRVAPDRATRAPVPATIEPG